TDLQELAGCDLVLEAVPEVLSIKRSVFAELEGVLAEDALLVTNTSSLSVAAMAEGLTHPERVVGLHFFNPVAKMPLVEVVHTEATDEATLATGLEVVRRLRKFAVRSADAPGFVVNRLLFRVLGAVLASVDAGADPAEVDASLDALGLPMRPFALLDLVGLAVADQVGTVRARGPCGCGARGRARRPLPRLAGPERDGGEAGPLHRAQQDLRASSGLAHGRRGVRHRRRRCRCGPDRGRPAGEGAGRARGGDRADARVARGRAPGAGGPRPDPGRRLPPPPRRHHSVPRRLRRLAARRRPHLPRGGVRRPRLSRHTHRPGIPARAGPGAGRV